MEVNRGEFAKRYNNSYPKPLWSDGLDFYYTFLQEHINVPVARKLYDLMKRQEVKFEDKIVVFFDNTEIGMTWTKLVWELGKELIAAMQEWEDKDDTIKK